MLAATLQPMGGELWSTPGAAQTKRHVRSAHDLNIERFWRQKTDRFRFKQTMLDAQAVVKR